MKQRNLKKFQKKNKTNNQLKNICVSFFFLIFFSDYTLSPPPPRKRFSRSRSYSYSRSRSKSKSLERFRIEPDITIDGEKNIIIKKERNIIFKKEKNIIITKNKSGYPLSPTFNASRKFKKCMFFVIYFFCFYVNL